ncbi:MAG: cyclic nucleotide-binding domain-containing protein [Oligoflexia bacterium]|nr:cyclic nucleotide-binding domain-containing protein [Oligoflexia bacterium]
MEPSLSLEQIITFLLEAPLFGDLSADGLADMVKIVQIRRFTAGQTVFAEGEVGDAWYVVFLGQVGVARRGAGGQMRALVSLERRACFGEMAVLDGAPRSATVVAETDSTLLRFPRGAFQDLLVEGKLAAYRLVLGMARVLCERQRRLTADVQTLLDHAEADPVGVRRRVEDLVGRYPVSE